MEGEKTGSTPSDGQHDGIQKSQPLRGRTTGPTRRSTKGHWTAEEDEVLRSAVHQFQGKNWKKIAECFKDRTDVQCLHRWQKVLDPELVKGPWSKEEDETIIDLVHKCGQKKWSSIARHLPGRIGKQCRERWHNHLNPSINREAWSQQEELALIRAHQIYGNKWAELSKFLPGRTDNAIKNHWNSSVKKKLESYLASGLLDHFPGLPVNVNPNQSVCAASSKMQCSEEGKGTRAEEISECSQDSTAVVYSQSASDSANNILYKNEELHSAEQPVFSNEHRLSDVSYSKHYYAPLEGEACCSSNFDGHNLSHIAESSASMNYQLTSDDLPSSGLPIQCTDFDESHRVVNETFQTSLGNMVVTASNSEKVLIYDEECCRVLFSDAMDIECLSSVNFKKGSDVSDSVARSDSLLLQPPNPLSSENTCSQAYLSAPSQLSEGEATLSSGGPSNQLNRPPFGNQGQDNSLICNDASTNTLTDQTSEVKESSTLVSISTHGSPPFDEDLSVLTDQQDEGALCYDPPRFPSAEVPFFSCDLIQSGTSDMQLEYSPLGIRQLMMSSMNCLTPFRLWDSPTRDTTPEGVLKSAAKTFVGTPSILRKRNRDLLSPLSNVRGDKDIDPSSSANKAFSRLDIIFDNCGSEKESQVDDKENQGPALRAGKENDNNQASMSNSGTSKRNLESEHFQEKIKQEILRGDAKTNADSAMVPLVKPKFGVLVERGPSASDNRILDEDCGNWSSKNTINTDSDTSTHTEERSGVLGESKMKDISILSPDQLAINAGKREASSALTPRNQYNRSKPGRVIMPESSSAYQYLVVCSPSGCRKNIPTHQNAVTSALSKNTVDNTRKEHSNTPKCIFRETPFKRRSMESPSAWKSPWFMNSFIPGPRIETDITIEDIGYTLSPADRSYDAIGLMKQLSGHTATAYADALEVLGNDTPETILKRKCSNIENLNKENNTLDYESHLASNVLSECRVLDFSECGSPGKEKDRKPLAAVTFSSPSSYLLRGFR